MSSAKRLSFLKKRIKEAHRYMSEMETDLVMSKYREDQSERKILVHEAALSFPAVIQPNSPTKYPMNR